MLDEDAGSGEGCAVDGEEGVARRDERVNARGVSGELGKFWLVPGDTGEKMGPDCDSRGSSGRGSVAVTYVGMEQRWQRAWGGSGCRFGLVVAVGRSLG